MAVFILESNLSLIFGLISLESLTLNSSNLTIFFLSIRMPATISGPNTEPLGLRDLNPD